MLVTPVSIPALGTPLPDPLNRLTYGPLGRAMWGWETEILQPGINAIGNATYQNALDAADSAVMAASAPGFRGVWSTLSGPLEIPASVYHVDDVWVLLEDVLDVTAVEPGVSPVWIPRGLVKTSGDTMLGHLEVPANATGNQTPRASEVIRNVGGAARLPTWTTAGRPSTPQDGDTGFNTTLRCEETYDEALGVWVPSGWHTSSAVATGTSVDLVVPVWANEFKLGFISVSTNGTNPITIRARAGGVIETLGYLGFSHIIQAASVANGANLSTSFNLAVNTAAATYQGVATFQRVTGNTWNARGSFARSDAAILHAFTGQKQTASALESVAIGTVGNVDTFDNGAFTLSAKA